MKKTPCTCEVPDQWSSEQLAPGATEMFSGFTWSIFTWSTTLHSFLRAPDCSGGGCSNTCSLRFDPRWITTSPGFWSPDTWSPVCLCVPGRPGTWCCPRMLLEIWSDGLQRQAAALCRRVQERRRVGSSRAWSQIRWAARPAMVQWRKVEVGEIHFENLSNTL